MLLRYCLCVLVLTLCHSAEAATPTLAGLFPAGAARGSTVEVTASGAFERWPVRAWVEGAGVSASANPAKGKLTFKVDANATPGLRWVRLFDEQGASSLEPFVLGVLPEVNEQEPNDDFRKPQVLAGPGVTVNGRLGKAGDVDCFALPLKAGQTLVASVEANRRLGSPMDGVLQVLSADGFVLAENNDFHGLDPQVVFPVRKDGTYVVRLFAFPAVPDTSIGLAGGERFVYRLTLTCGGWLDHAFPLAVSRVGPVPVELRGWNIPEAARKVPSKVPELPGDTAIIFHPDLAGTAEVRVEPHATAMHSGAGDSKEPQNVELPVSVSGRIEGKGVVHVYQFRARKGQRLDFQVESAALGFPLDASLRLTDSAGKVLARAEGPAPGADPSLSFPVPAEGAYRIEVRDLLDQGGPRHLYRLRMLEAAADFSLTLPADSFTLAAGKPLDLVVAIERHNGFARPIELNAEGLPKGVMASQLPSAPGAATVTLRLSASKEATPASGSFRISGRVKDTGDVLHPARAKLAKFGVLTAHLWLTVRR